MTNPPEDAPTHLIVPVGLRHGRTTRPTDAPATFHHDNQRHQIARVKHTASRCLALKVIHEFVPDLPGTTTPTGMGTDMRSDGSKSYEMT
jgi:hypothetical protein